MRISSRTRRLRNISSVGARMCVCVCVSIYLRRHNRHRESEIGCDSPGCGVTNVITSLLEIPVRENRSAPIPWGYSRPNLIRSHAPRLPGRRPSSAVHLFCVSSRGRLLHNSEGRLRRHRCRKTLDLKNVFPEYGEHGICSFGLRVPRVRGTRHLLFRPRL
jgi:hypothetical protein